MLFSPIPRSIVLAAAFCMPALCQFGRGGPGGPPGFGGPGFGGQDRELKILAQFDKDGDGYLNAAERKAARAYLTTMPRRGDRFGGPDMEPALPGPKISPADVKTYKSEPLPWAAATRSCSNFKRRVIVESEIE